MRKGFSLLWVTVVLIAALMMPGSAFADAFVDEIPLPDGWLPEGIDTGGGPYLYSGSRADGAVYRADLRTGEGEVFVEGAAGRVAVGLKYSERCNVLVVAGGGTGQGYVYDGSTGDLLQTYQFTPAATTDAPTFINDVDVTNDYAYFTNSSRAELYRVDLRHCDVPTSGFDVIPLGGEWDQVAGFNANGIVARPNGKVLIIVNSTTGNLYRVELKTGEVTQVDLGAEGLVTMGDGLALGNKTQLYVVRNRANEIVEIKLNSDWERGTVVDTYTQSNFDVPTTIAFFGDVLYAVNARFGVASPETATYNVVRVEFDQ